MNTMLLMFLYYINMSFCAFFKCWERSRSDIKTLKAVLPKRRSWERFLTIEKRSHVTFQERSTIENVRSKRERSQGGLIVKTSSNENDDQLYLENVPPFVFVPKSAKTKKRNVLSFSTKGVVRSKSFFVENETSNLSFLTLFSIVFFACKEINLINKEALESII